MRDIVKISILLSLLALALLLPAAGAPPPVAVFADLDGTWEGTFVGYGEGGEELYRVRVRQTYRTVSDTVQEVEIEDRMADGTVVTGRGRNLAERREDGTLALRCVVEKSDGDRVEHEGRLVTGPGGDRQILWHSSAPGRSEIFRERVRREGGEEVYRIDGLGSYGDTRILMAGRYVKVEL